MRKKFGLMFLLVYMMSLVMLVQPIFAAGEPKKDIVISDSADQVSLKAVMKELQDSGKTTRNGEFSVILKPNAPSGMATNVLVVDSNGKNITFYPTIFDNATEKSRRVALQTFVEGMQASQVSKQTQQNVMNRLSAENADVSRLLIPMVMDSTKADLYGAMKVINPALPIIRLIFGIGAFVIFILLMASSIVDLVFIGIPFAREMMQNRGDQNGSGGKVPFVSNDALSVVKEVESSIDSSGGYKNAYLIYFKRRVWTYVLLSICVLYLVVGELGGLIAWLLNLVSGTTLS